MIKLGELEIHLISDGQVMVDGGGPFGLVPRTLWSRYLQPTEDNLVPMSLNCLLVKTAGKNILVDVGFGTNKLDERQLRNWGLTRPTGTLLDGLARLGIQPDDIDIVINTHLHADHCTGNTTYGENGAVLPTFPNARHVVQRREFEDAMHPNERTRGTYWADNFKPLYENGQLELLEGDTEIAAGVQAVVTPGHTPGHMSVLLESGGQYALFLCDLASFAVNFEKLAWMTAYDVEPLVTLETKRKWQKWALEKDPLLIFVHDTLMPLARYRLNEQGQPHLVAEPAVFA